MLFPRPYPACDLITCVCECVSCVASVNAEKAAGWVVLKVVGRGGGVGWGGGQGRTCVITPGKWGGDKECLFG